MSVLPLLIPIPLPPPIQQNNPMSTEIKSQEDADREAVYVHAFEGQPLDPDVRRRVRERAARITEEMHKVHGFIDDETFQKLLDES